MCDENEDGCANVEMDFSPEIIKHLRVCASEIMADLNFDKCSMEILDECPDDADFDTLATALGVTMLNGIVVDLIAKGIEATDATANTDVETADENVTDK